MENNQILVYIEQLLSYASQKLMLEQDDIHITRNNLLFLFRESEPTSEVKFEGDFQSNLLDKMVEYAIEQGITTKELALTFETRLLGMVMPLPSAIRDRFDQIAFDSGIEQATTWFNKLCVDCNYIRMIDVAKNIYWTYNGYQGEVGITINLSKPEKDPKDIERALKEKKVAYPKCMLCPSNVGFFGNLNHPARSTLRTIPIVLNKEKWHFQYSPYMYFDEHCIALSDEHRNMLVNEDTYTRLLDFVDLFPHYFIGSNAALPIVGGSILTHDHYQGGLKVLPVMKRPARFKFISNTHTNVSCAIVDWYNSVVRLTSSSRKDLHACAIHISSEWDKYTNESVGIYAHTTAKHNAITPIAIKDGNNYVLDLILRNNRTDDKHPYGIYHPTEDLHNIKKEGIGLIEAMGRFILPGRLSTEAVEIKNYLTGATPLDIKAIANPDHPMSKHLGMICQLATDHGTNLDDEKAGDVVTQYINNACVRILECTAVFKNNVEGLSAFNGFLNICGFYSGEMVENSMKPNVVTTVRNTMNKDTEQKNVRPIENRPLTNQKIRLHDNRPTMQQKSNPIENNQPIQNTQFEINNKPNDTAPVQTTSNSDAPRKRGRPRKA